MYTDFTANYRIATQRQSEIRARAAVGRFPRLITGRIQRSTPRLAPVIGLSSPRDRVTQPEARVA
jgi:hypothetical protein